MLMYKLKGQCCFAFSRRKQHNKWFYMKIPIIIKTMKILFMYGSVCHFNWSLVMRRSRNAMILRINEQWNARLSTFVTVGHVDSER